MAYITIIIDDIIPSTPTAINVNFRYFAVDGTTATDSGNMDVTIQQNATQMNQAVVDNAVALAAAQGVTLAPQDRRFLVGGMTG